MWNGKIYSSKSHLARAASKSCAPPRNERLFVPSASVIQRWRLRRRAARRRSVGEHGYVSALLVVSDSTAPACSLAPSPSLPSPALSWVRSLVSGPPIRQMRTQKHGPGISKLPISSIRPLGGKGEGKIIAVGCSGSGIMIMVK